MLKNIIGALIFTAAILAFVNFIGDIAIQPNTDSDAPISAPETAMDTPEPTPATSPEPAPEPAPVAMPEPEPEPASAPITPASVAQTATETASTAMTTGDVKKGKTTFRKKCMSCHTIDKGGQNRTGPNLWAIIGREKAIAENFRYSKTMKMLGGVWTEAEISSFIAGPRTFLPDTKMAFPGLKKEKDRADVLAFLKTLAD